MTSLSPVEPAHETPQAPVSVATRSPTSQKPLDTPATAVYRPRKPVEIRTRPSLDFSITGLVYCAMLLFMGLAAINTQANLLFGVFGLMIGVLLISFVISRWVLRRLTVRRQLPDYAAVGSPVRITYEIDNRKRWWPTLSVTIAELDAPGAFDRQPHAYVMHAAAGMSAIVAAEVVPMRRGLHRLERYQVATSFPFGFIRRAMIRRQGDLILIHPAQGAVEPTVMSRFLSAESSGINQRPREGGADEFYGAREYRPGDPMRMIHWRRSARSAATRTPSHPQGTLIVKQMTRVSPPRLLLLVDTYAPAFKASDREAGADAELAARALIQQRLADVERNLATAASLLAAAVRNGLSVGVVAADKLDWVEIMPERGKRHQRDVLTALAGLGRNSQRDVEQLVAKALPQTTGDTTAVLISAGRSGSASTNCVQAAGAAQGRAGGRGGPRSGRGNLMVIRSVPGELDRWVRFDPALDFLAMIPEETD
jgi:uncharacterized protein (DUF58 family)